jgi:hypothetical protein
MTQYLRNQLKAIKNLFWCKASIHDYLAPLLLRQYMLRETIMAEACDRIKWFISWLTGSRERQKREWGKRCPSIAHLQWLTFSTEAPPPNNVMKF